MKNNRSYSTKLFLSVFIFTFSLLAFAVDEPVKSNIDKKMAIFEQTISETEQELKEPDLTGNELKIFRNKLLRITESLLIDEKEYNKKIDKQNELIENYTLSFLKKDKNRAFSDTGCSVEKFKKLREEISLYKTYLNSIQKLKEKVELLLDDIQYKGLRNRTKEIFLLSTPFYEPSVWTEGYKDLIQLSIDGKEKLREIANELNDKIIARLLFLFGAVLLIIYVYAKACIKISKFLLSKLDCNTTKEITQYKDLLFEKSFFILSRFLVCFLIPVKILRMALDYYSAKYFFFANTSERLFVLIFISTLIIIWNLQAMVSTYFIKKLNFLHPLLTRPKAFKSKMYGAIYLIAGLCFINYIDIVNVAINFNPMVYPDCAAILNLLIIILLSVTVFRISPYITRYIKSANKRESFIAQIIRGVLVLWAILAPIMIFIGLSNITIDITLKTLATGALLFLWYYAYHVIKEVIPLIIGAIISFFNRIASIEEEKYLEHEHELHKKHLDGRNVLKYWTNFLLFIGMTILFSLNLLIVWGFPQNTLSLILDTIFFEQIHVAGKPTFSISLLLTSFVSGLIIFYIFKIIQYVFEVKVFPYTRFDEGTRHAFKTAIGYIGLFFAVVIFIYALGVNMTALTFIISGLSIGIGFSLQELFKNFFSGFVLLIERPIKVGDILSIDGCPAKVKKIKIRCTVLESLEKNTIVIPNSELVNSRLINETTFPLSRAEIAVDVAYSEDPIKVAELLKALADSHTKVSKTFKATVEFVKFKEHSITLILNVFVKRIEKDEIISNLNFMIFKAMKDNKIVMREIPPSNIYIKEVAWDKKG